jgi:hypothetical protein
LLRIGLRFRGGRIACYYFPLTSDVGRQAKARSERINRLRFARRLKITPLFRPANFSGKKAGAVWRESVVGGSASPKTMLKFAASPPNYQRVAPAQNLEKFPLADRLGSLNDKSLPGIEPVAAAALPQA